MDRLNALIPEPALAPPQLRAILFQAPAPAAPSADRELGYLRSIHGQSDDNEALVGPRSARRHRALLLRACRNNGPGLVGIDAEEPTCQRR